MIVDYTFYSAVYMGTEVNQTSFPTLYAHASRIISALTRWQVTEENFSELPSIVQTMYKLAICSQIDFFAINGIDFVNSTGGGGFTVGRVSVFNKSKTGESGAMSESVSPAAIMYLEQGGLMNPSVPVVEGCVC